MSTPPLFPLPPSDGADIVVARRWLTDRLASETGAEQAVSLRDEARVELTFGIVAPDAAAVGTLQSYLEAADGDLRFRLPYWPDAVALYGALAAEATVVSVVTTDRAFTAGGQALLLAPDGSYELVTIAADGVASDSLTLSEGAAAAWPALATVAVPVVVGVLTVPARLDLVGPQSETATLTFVVETPLAGVALTDDGEVDALAVAAILIDPQRDGQGAGEAAGAFAPRGTHWYYRARATDAVGTPVQRPAIVWTASSGTVHATADPAVARLDTTGVTGDITLTATVGEVSASRTVTAS